MKVWELENLLESIEDKNADVVAVMDDDYRYVTMIYCNENNKTLFIYVENESIGL